MPLQNRVTPFGEIVADPWRGRLTGNRGCLHGTGRTLGVRRWTSSLWITCQTSFRGRHRDVMPPGRWTALFFWDEPAALAAGHRPCGECRNAAYKAFKAAWIAAGLDGRSATEINRFLHQSRVTRARQQITFEADSRDLPDGTFVSVGDLPKLPMMVWEGRLWHLSLTDGAYFDAGPPPDRVTVLTPEPVVRVLSAGYRVVPRWTADD